MSVYQGWLHKRNVPISPPSMSRIYCVLWGTLLLDYESEEDSRASMSPKVACEILGISEWDGQGRANQYPNGFLLVTHTGGTYYLSASSPRDRDDWIVHVKRSLECHFANTEIIPFKPSKIIHSRPPFQENTQCPRTRAALPPVSSYSGPLCRSCARAFSSSEHVSSFATLLQVGAEAAEKVCLDCFDAQGVIVWLKSLNYTHTMALHELTPDVNSDIGRYKATFRLTRRPNGSRLDMAAKLLEQKSISADEFEEMRRLDEDCRIEAAVEEAEKVRAAAQHCTSHSSHMTTSHTSLNTKLKSALDAIGVDMMTLISLLLNPTATARGGRLAYFQLIVKILEIADQEPELIDFYLPQLLQAHLVEAGLGGGGGFTGVSIGSGGGGGGGGGGVGGDGNINSDGPANTAIVVDSTIIKTANPVSSNTAATINPCSSLTKVDLLQQAMLVLAQRHPPLGLKMAWGLIAVTSDYHEKRGNISARQFSCCVALLLQLELIVTGMVSALVPRPPQADSWPDTDIDGARHIAGADAPPCRLLASVIRPAGHQQNELAAELGTLCLVRRRLQELQSAKHQQHALEENGRQGGCLGASGEGHERLGEDGAGADFYPASTRGSGPNPLANCLELLLHLGVGQATPMPASEEGINPNRLLFRPPHWPGFAHQLDFMERLGFVVDSLRACDRGMRGQRLAEALEGMNAESTVAVTSAIEKLGLELGVKLELGTDFDKGLGNTIAPRSPYLLHHLTSHDQPQALGPLGWDPTSPAGQPLYRITNIVVGECRVFRTKARAPSLIAAVVVRDDSEAVRLETVFGDTDSADPLMVPSPVPVGAMSPHSEGLVSLPSSARGRSRTCSAEVERAMNNSHSASPVTKADPSSSSVAVLSEADSLVQSGIGKAIEEIHSVMGKVNPQANIVRSRGPGSLLSTHRKSGSSSFHQLLTSASTGDLQLTLTQAAGPGLEKGAAGDQREGLEHLFSPTSQSSCAYSPHGSALGLAVPNPTICSDSGSGSRANAFVPASDSSNSAFGLSPIDPSNSSNGQFPSPTSNNQPGQIREIAQSALLLLHEGKIDTTEFEQLLKCDSRYRDEAAREEMAGVLQRVEMAFGESWEAKKDRLLGSAGARNISISLPPSSTFASLISGHRFDAMTEGKDYCSAKKSLDLVDKNQTLTETHASVERPQDSARHDSTRTPWPLWDLRAFIVKSNDDLRQEVCCVQLLRLFQEIFCDYGLAHQLWLRPYAIVSTGASTGVVQVLTDALSLDALKKAPGFLSLPSYFLQTYGSSTERLLAAKRNFASSLAAYSLFTYLLAVKDRHNGNMLLDTEGHIIHIDFGFLLGLAPGGAFSLETAPFKLTEEWVDVLGGLESPLFGEYVKAFTIGFLALRANAENIVETVQVLSICSPFPCFAGRDATAIVDRLRQRFRTDLSLKDLVQHCLDLIIASYGHYGTRQYDSFQWYSNGIAT